MSLAACSADDLDPLDADATDEESSDDAGSDVDTSSSDGDAGIDDDDLDQLATDRPGARTRRGPGARNTIASGSVHTCVVRSDGTVRCWGSGVLGALGDGELETSNVPVVVSGASNIIAIAAGWESSVALRSDGTVWRWGVRHGQVDELGFEIVDATPMQVPGLSGIIALGSGIGHSCAVRSDGHVLCWGVGTLGDGVTTESATPVEVAGISNAIAVDVGAGRYVDTPVNALETTACALLATGSVKCWGSNSNGQIGDGTYATALTPVTVPGISNAVSVSTDASATCVALADGTLRCWGRSIGTEDEPGNDSLVPIQIAGVTSAEEVSIAGMDHACALLVDGTERCWGRNEWGELGNGTWTDSATPVAVSGADDVTAMSTGHGWSCALRSDGTARCWGRNSVWGMLGNGDPAKTNSNVPVVVSGLTSANDGPRIAVGPYHTCGLRGDGTVKCWGDNSLGQLGTGNQVDTSTPTQVANLSGVRDLAAGGAHTCAVLDTGSVRCWGRNLNGELGDAGASGFWSVTPVAVAGLVDAVQIAATNTATCAVRTGGTVACWGNNQYGQLGSGNFVDSNVPVAVANLTNVVAIDMFNAHVCALTASGSVRCWGHNLYGQLGNGTSGNNSNVPVTVMIPGPFWLPLGNAVAIGVGNAHSCAVISNGTARCWGGGLHGALGNGASNDQSTPVTVSGLTTAVDISLGSSSTCALRANGSARCWGTDTYGELGNGNGATPDTSTPVSVGTFPLYLSNASTIDSGFDNTCVTRGNGTISCWGLNGDGQLGDGTTTNRYTPVSVISFP